MGATYAAPHAVACKRPSIPGVVAEDAVCFGDDVPPLYIVKIGSIGVARLDVLPVELRSQSPDLCIAKRHHLVLTLSTGLELLISAPGISMPLLSSPRMVCRSSFGGCGNQ